MSDDPHRLERFVAAQDDGDVYGRAVAELREGRKAGHWMWFVFPQIAGLGRSEMAARFAITSMDEAKAYLEHPLLGPRLEECAGILTQLGGPSAREIFGVTDEMKLRSSMTLFACAAPDRPVFEQVLTQYFGGIPDSHTLRRLPPTDRGGLMATR